MSNDDPKNDPIVRWLTSDDLKRLGVKNVQSVSVPVLPIDRLVEMTASDVHVERDVLLLRPYRFKDEAQAVRVIEDQKWDKVYVLDYKKGEEPQYRDKLIWARLAGTFFVQPSAQES